MSIKANHPHVHNMDSDSVATSACTFACAFIHPAPDFDSGVSASDDSVKEGVEGPVRLVDKDISNISAAL